MTRGISFKLSDQSFWVVFWSDAVFGNREVEAVEREGAIPHVGVAVGKTRDDGSPLEVDDYRVGRLSAQNFLIGTDCVDASAGDGQRLGPGGLWIAGIDVAVDEQGVGGEQRGNRE